MYHIELPSFHMELCRWQFDYLCFPHHSSILWPPEARTDSLEKTPVLGKIESKRIRGWHWMRWLDSITDSVDMSKLQEVVKGRGAWCAAVHLVAKSQR